MKNSSTEFANTSNEKPMGIKMFRTNQMTPGVKRIPVRNNIDYHTSQTVGIHSTHGQTPDLTPASGLLKLGKFQTPAKEKQMVSIFDTTTIDQMPSVKARQNRK